MKDWLVRALKTFAQAFISVLITNAALINSHILCWDWSNWQTWLLPVIASAGAAGISACWNIIQEAVNNSNLRKKENQEMIATLQQQVLELEEKLAAKGTKAK